MSTSDTLSSKKRAVDPYVGLKAGDHVCLSSPLVDPIHWQFGKVLWRDERELLAVTSNFSGKPEKHLHDIVSVRVFGTREHCQIAAQHAASAVRNAANISREVEDMATDLRRKMVDLFETVAAAALKTSKGTAS